MAKQTPALTVAATLARLGTDGLRTGLVALTESLTTAQAVGDELSTITAKVTTAKGAVDAGVAAAKEQIAAAQAILE